MSRSRPGSLMNTLASRMPPGQRAAAYAALSAMLRYPDEALICDLPMLRRAVAGAPAGVRGQFEAVVSWLDGTPLLEAQAAYVATFDMHRKCCLYLSYYLSGDTRRRGEALWRFQDTCRRAGFRILLELAASGGEREAVALIQEHRAGIELLHQALSQAGSPYASLVGALRALLPAALPGTASSAARLMADGPPAERVGVEPPAMFSPYQPGGRGAEGGGQR
jgi:nitrate reductase delta subunit